MPETETYERARGRAEVKYGFFVHAVVYVAVMVLLVVINMLTSPGTIWFIWPLVGWGLAVALHSALVFLFADRDTIVDALTERELRHSQSPPFACLRSLGGGWTAPLRVQYVCTMDAKTGSRSMGDLLMPNNTATAAARLSTAPMMDWNDFELNPVA